MGCWNGPVRALTGTSTLSSLTSRLLPTLWILFPHLLKYRWRACTAHSPVFSASKEIKAKAWVMKTLGNEGRFLPNIQGFLQLQIFTQTGYHAPPLCISGFCLFICWKQVLCNCRRWARCWWEVTQVSFPFKAPGTELRYITESQFDWAELDQQF